jgi:hypothetical protein
MLAHRIGLPLLPLSEGAGARKSQRPSFSPLLFLRIGFKRVAWERTELHGTQADRSANPKGKGTEAAEARTGNGISSSDHLLPFETEWRRCSPVPGSC